MKNQSLYIRLLIATAAATVSAVFVAIYSGLSVPVVLASVHMHFDVFPLFTQWLANYCWYALLVPACLLAAGIFVLTRWRNKAAFELVVGFQWLFALVWPLCCFLVWLLPQVPFGE
ncbi:MAG: hypothetical protein ABSA47_01200 [Verrucomicrobiota bacterium]|jgi:hypothetical protein